MFRVACALFLVGLTTLCWGCKERKKDVKEQPIVAVDLGPEDASTVQIDATPGIKAPVAYFLEDGKLVRLVAAEDQEVVVIDGDFCHADSLAKVIWIAGKTGLFAYDLSNSSLMPIVEAPDIDAFELRFGDARGKVGNVRVGEHDVALVVMVTPLPDLRAEVICEGARESDCYVESDSDDPEQWELKPAVAAMKKRYESMALASPRDLAAIAKRRRVAGDAPAVPVLAPEPRLEPHGGVSCGFIRP